MGGCRRRGRRMRRGQEKVERDHVYSKIDY